MKKTFKKSDINKYIQKNMVSELVNKNGSLINPTNNYVQNRNHIKSKKTTDDFVRNSTQGPEAYFIYGGPYYGVNYSYVVNEEDTMGIDSENDDINYDELEIIPSVDEEISESEDSMKSLVDEIIRNKKDGSHDILKRVKEQDIVGDEVVIPDISELRDVHEKPMVIRKLNSLLDLIHKENLKGEELSIILNHLINNLDIYSIDERHREIIGDKIKYVEEEGK